MVVAAAVGVASLTYLAGLRHLERTPRLLGWNWDAAVSFNFEFLNQSDPTESAGILAEMEQLDSVEQITGGTFYPPWFLFVPGSATFVWPWSFATGPQAVAPTMLTGRAPRWPRRSWD